MNLLDARVALRLRTVADVLDLAFAFLVENRRTYLRLGLIVLAPCVAVCAALHRLVQLPWWSVWLVAVALGEIVEGVFTVAAGELLFAEAPPVRALLARYARRLPSLLAAMAWAGLFMALPALPGIAFLPSVPVAGLALIAPVGLYWRVVFVREASLLETASPRQAFLRSRRLARGHFFPLYGMGFCLVLASVGATAVTEALAQGVVGFTLQLGEPLGSIWDDGGSVWALAGFFLSVPYAATARFLGYANLRTRKEGWDIQLKFMAIEAGDLTDGKVA